MALTQEDVEKLAEVLEQSDWMQWIRHKMQQEAGTNSGYSRRPHSRRHHGHRSEKYAARHDGHHHGHHGRRHHDPETVLRYRKETAERAKAICEDELKRGHATDYALTLRHVRQQEPIERYHAESTPLTDTEQSLQREANLELQLQDVRAELASKVRSYCEFHRVSWDKGLQHYGIADGELSGAAQAQ